MAHQDLLNDAFEAINKLVSDTSVDKSVTHDSLEELEEEIATRLVQVETK